MSTKKSPKIALCQNPECSREFEVKPATKGLYCSHSCRAKVTNLGRNVSESEKLKKSIIMRNKPKRLMTQQRVAQEYRDTPYAYTRIFYNTCKKTGKKFIYKSQRGYLPEFYSEFQEYRRQCQFKFNPFSFPLWFNTSEMLKMVQQNGWYSTPGSRNGLRNINGVSRDHILSCKAGFINNINPSKISHPANFQLLTHNDNQRKCTKSTLTENALDKLISDFERIYPNWQDV